MRGADCRDCPKRPAASPSWRPLSISAMRAQLDEARSEVDRLRAGIGAYPRPRSRRPGASGRRHQSNAEARQNSHSDLRRARGGSRPAVSGPARGRQANLAVAHILEEVQAKVPVIRRRAGRMSAECACRAWQLAKRLDESNVRLETDERGAGKEGAFFERENARLKARAGDWARQRAFLPRLNPVEAVRLPSRAAQRRRPLSRRAGKKPADSQQQAALDLSALSEQPQSTQEVITSSAADIRRHSPAAAAQHQPGGGIRELAARLEVLERERSDASELRVKLESATSELQLARSAEKQHRDLLKVASQQRDMYKLLLESARNSSADPAAAAASVPMETDQQQQQQQPQTTAASTTLATSGVASERPVICHAELSKLRTELSQSRSAARHGVKQRPCPITGGSARVGASLLSKLETARSVAPSLAKPLRRYRREIDILREMNEKYTGMLAKHEQEAVRLQSQLIERGQSVTRLEAQLELAKQQAKALRASESRLTVECEQLRQDRLRQGLLMTSLQAVQVNLENAIKKSARLPRLESRPQPNGHLSRTPPRRGESALAAERSAAEAALPAPPVSLRSPLNAWRPPSAAPKAAEERGSRSGRFSAVEQSEAADKAESSQPEDNDQEKSSAIAAYKEELAELRERLKAMERDCELLRGQAENYRAMAEGAEARLTQQAEEHARRWRVRGQASERQESIDYYRSQLDSLERERQTLVSDRFKQTEEAHAMNADLRKQLHDRQQELQAAVERRDAADRRQSRATAEAAKAAEAADKYQQELLLHARADARPCRPSGRSWPKRRRPAPRRAKRRANRARDYEKRIAALTAEAQRLRASKTEAETRLTQLAA
uniref:Centrosomal protein of 162 kDa n=1 Tax=Macrostomum lignano TaxID=282301 RepID=A0A1I8F9T9_9PLAT